MWVPSASLVGATWRKSSHSGGEGQCVEVADLHRQQGIRDSKNPTGPTLVFAPVAFAAFLDGVKSDQTKQ